MPLAYETRKRDIPFDWGNYRVTRRTYYTGGGPPDYPGAFELKDDSGIRVPPVSSSLKGTQITVSENHPLWNRRIPGKFPGDIGGDFSTTKYYIDGGKPSIVNIVGGNQVSGKWIYGPAQYVGALLPIDPSHSSFRFPELNASSNSRLIALGTEAIAKVKPTNTTASAAVALTELYREGLPKIIGSQLWRSKTQDALKKGGSEYLNVEFGWKPLVNDIKDAVKAITKSDEILAQYERDSGRIVRRKYEFPTEESSTTTVVKTATHPFMWATDALLFTDPNAAPTGRVIMTETSVRKRWFSGAFTYHAVLPSNEDNALNNARKANKLFGTTVTPDVVWNVTPWSWLADWVTNTGDVISNLSDWATDGLVLRWGYIMEHCISTKTFTYVGTSPYIGGHLPRSLTLVNESKRRLRATPFGFGITWEGFSPKQLSILAALGITKRK